MEIQNHHKKNPSIRDIIELSILQALHCEIDYNLRMVGVDWNVENGEMHIFFYFDKCVTESNKDSASSVMSEVWADFENQFTQICDHCLQFDIPKPLPNHMSTIFLRNEKSDPLS